MDCLSTLLECSILGAPAGLRDLVPYGIVPRTTLCPLYYVLRSTHDLALLLLRELQAYAAPPDVRPPPAWAPALVFVFVFAGEHLFHVSALSSIQILSFASPEARCLLHTSTHLAQIIPG
jgi:hypothetical protein